VATLKDIAQATGFSITTVSRVLNRTADQVGISEATQKKILQAAEAMNYQPSNVARGLRTGKMQVVALVVRDMANPFFAEVACAVQDELESHGYDLLLFNAKDPSGANDDSVRRLFNMIYRWPIGGLIICQDMPLSPDDCKRLRLKGIPVVMINPVLHEGIDAVFVDDRIASRDAVQHLLERGHRRIGYLAGPKSMPTGKARLEGYIDALTAHGIPVDDRLIVDVAFTAEGGARAMDVLLRLDPPPSAVAAANDVSAFGALKVALDRGLSVPGDLAIIGFDNVGVLTYPALSTVDHNQVGLGRTAVALLMERIKGDAAAPRKVVVLEHRLVIRDTT